MHVLLVPVVQKQAAVLKILPQLDAVPGEKVPDDGVTQLAQVAGDDQVIVVGLRVGVPEEGGEAIVGRRGHGRAHVVGIGNALVHDLAAGDVGDVRAGAVRA